MPPQLLTAPRGYSVRPRPATLSAAHAEGQALLARTAKRARIWAKVRSGTANDAERAKLLTRLSLDARHEVRGLADRLIAGTISRRAWHNRTAALLPARFYAGALALLGSLSEDERAEVDREIAAHLGYLRRFNTDLAVGTQKLDGTVRNRADLYGGAIHSVAQNALLRRREDEGFTECRRELGSADHCRNHGGLQGCVEQAAMGWMPIATMLKKHRIGNSPCRSRCRCEYQFRKQSASAKRAMAVASQERERVARPGLAARG